MILYLIKSATCLALLLAFYHLVLEREKMHNFNRFYLLGSVVFSFLVPLYIIYVDANPIVFETVQTVTSLQTNDIISSHIIIEKPFDYTLIFIAIYGLISLILLIRFAKNLFNIISKINKNEKINYQKAILVLVDDEILPHTFWNYIFINKNDYENKKIEQELFTHELTHVTQKHTLDVVILELIQALFWINPFFILLKKAVQLNHEFLADEKVINEHKNTFQYQHLLLNKAAWKNEYYLASNLNYSLTKKRLKMMTTQSSQTKIWMKKLAVIPLLAGFVFLFAQRVEAQEAIEITEEPLETIFEQNIDSQTITEQVFTKKGDKISTGFIELRGAIHYFVTVNNDTKYYNRKGQLADNAGKVLSNKKAKSSEVIPDNYITRTFYKNKVFCEFYDDIPNRIIVTEDLTEIIKSLDYISTIDHIKKYKNKNILYFFNGKKIKYKKALDLIENDRPLEILTQKIDGKTVIKLIKEKKKKYNKPSSNGSKQSIPSNYINNIKLKIEDVNKLVEKTNNSILKEYNILAKKYNAIPVEKRIIQLRDLNKLETLYRQLTGEEKKDAQPFPECYLPKNKNEEKNIREKYDLNSYNKLNQVYEFKKNTKRPIHPQDPYVKLMKNDKVFYKLRKDLTEEDKLLFPPPPLKPYATKAEILRNKKAYKAWQKRTGNTLKEIPSAPKKKISKKTDINLQKQIERNKLDLIIDMAKNDAIFYFEKQVISSDKAIELLKKNTNLNIHSEATDFNSYTVWISNNKKSKSITKNKLSDFEIKMNKKADKIVLTCSYGCDWKELTFILKEDKLQAKVNQFGTKSTKNDKSSFMFYINYNFGRVNLQSNKGAAWKQLGFNLKNNGTIDQFGVRTK